MDTKSKVSLPYRLLTLLLAIILTLTCVPDLPVFAGYNGSGTGTGSGSYAGVGINPDNCGIRVYIYDYNNNKVKYIKDIFTKEFKNHITNVSSYVCGYTYRTRLGDRSDSLSIDYIYESDLPSGINFTNSSGSLSLNDYVISKTSGSSFGFEAHGKRFADYMQETITSGGKEVQRLQAFVRWLFGTDAYNETMSNGYKVVVEPIIASPTFNGYYSSNYTGIDIYSTVEGFHYYCKKANITRSGGFIGRPLATLASGFELDKDDDDCGLKAGDGNFVYGSSRYSGWDDYKDIGYGIHIYTVAPEDPGDPIHTYDIDTNPDIPATTEKPKTGKESDNKDKIANDDESAGRKDGEVEIVKLYGYAYKRHDYDSDSTKGQFGDEDGGKRFVKIEQTDHRIDANGNSLEGYFLRQRTTDKIVIKDESDKTGFAVWEWRTSKNLVSAYTNKYTVEEWVQADSFFI